MNNLNNLITQVNQGKGSAAFASAAKFNKVATPLGGTPLPTSMSQLQSLLNSYKTSKTVNTPGGGTETVSGSIPASIDKLKTAIGKTAKTADVSKTTAAIKAEQAKLAAAAAKQAAAAKESAAKAAKTTDVHGVKTSVDTVKKAIQTGKPIQVKTEHKITVTLDGKQVAKAIRIENLNNGRAQGQNAIAAGPGRGTGNA